MKVLFKKLILPCLTLFLFNMSFGQKITQFSEYKIIKDQYESTKIKITPHVRHKTIGENESKYESPYGVYGVLICYTVNGQKKAKRQDMSSDLKSKGYYETTLGYGSKAKVSSVSVSYFNMIDIPKKDWPKKEECF